MQKPLDNLKVLDLSRVLAGPYCTMLLSDMGAQVLKIERPGSGDDTRGYGPPFINGESAYFMSVNRNKRSMTLDLKKTAGLEILHQLILEADILVENFRPGTMEKFGYGYTQIKGINPQLIYCAISGYGHSGPKSALPGYDLIIQGEGGIASLTGDINGPPFKVGTSQADIIAGMNAFQGILLALLARQQTGLGQKVDIGLLDCQVSLLTYQAANYFATGDSPTRRGNQHPSITPYETFQCRDGYVNLACGNDRIWVRFCEIVGLDRLVVDPRFTTNAERVAHRDELEAELAPIMLEHTVGEWIELLPPNGIPAGAIQSVAEVCQDPQVLARDMVVELEHETAGKIKVTGIPIKLSGTPGSVDTAPPTLGQHTAEALEDWLNLSKQEIQSLLDESVI